MILRDFFSSLMTVSLSSSFSPSPSASVISERRAAARSSAGGVGCNGEHGTASALQEGTARSRMAGGDRPQAPQVLPAPWGLQGVTELLGGSGSSTADAHLGLGPVGVVLSLLHGRGHLVHGGDEDAAGLAQALVGVDALGTVDLQEAGGDGCPVTAPS